MSKQLAVSAALSIVAMALFAVSVPGQRSAETGAAVAAAAPAFEASLPASR